MSANTQTKLESVCPAYLRANISAFNAAINAAKSAANKTALFPTNFSTSEYSHHATIITAVDATFITAFNAAIL